MDTKRLVSIICHVFFFNDTATTEIYTLSLHDALPIYRQRRVPSCPGGREDPRARRAADQSDVLDAHHLRHPVLHAAEMGISGHSRRRREARESARGCTREREARSRRSTKAPREPPPAN